MELVIDCGNTFIKTGLFHQNKFIESGIFPNDEFSSIEQLVLTASLDAIILSSVIELPTEFMAKIQAAAPVFLELLQDTPIPFENMYRTPATLGKDRIAGVAGAMALSSGENVMVVDAGTCITIDVLANGKMYIGGSISPGLNMRLQAMHHFTHRLPQVELREFADLNGLTTEECMLAGALSGAVSEVDGFIDKWQNKLAGLKVYLTGGDGTILLSHLKSNIFAEPNLILTGLHKILLYNAH
ncbi:MAG: type III pantothenate kinase [Bacteroidia bacterium]